MGGGTMRLILVVLSIALMSGAGQQAAGQTAPADVQNPVELKGFVDGVMEAQLRAQRFAGAVVVVVRGGDVVLQKGYGYADYAGRKPVDPERTLFRIASNSKMFVWTSVMQLVEQGRLDIHADVNRYLKGIQVPPTFAEPVTLERLMTHTAGFEDRVIGLFSENPGMMRPLAELMRSQMPRRVFPPGQVAAYSNYGTTLAALIVEQVSGVPYERYLNENILRPLGMRHATLAQPLPPDLSADMSKGYEWSGGRLKEHPFEYVPWGPCGGMSSSGAAMARFMIAHMNDGALGEARILRPETARTMRSRLASPYPAGAGMLHGFFPLDWNGEKAFGHGGDTIWFHSQTAMLPEHGIGVFIAYNTDSGARARSEFLPVFLDHYFPVPLPKETPAVKDAARLLKRFAGVYFAARSSFSDLTEIGRLVTAQTIDVEGDGFLVSRSGGEVTRWREIEPLVFRQVDGKRRIVFRANPDGSIGDFCGAPLCVATMQKQPWWETPGTQWSFLGACLTALVAGLVGIPIAAAAHRRHPRPLPARIAGAWAWLTCLAWATGFAVFAAKIDEAQRVVFGVTPAVRQSLWIWAVAAALTLVMAAFGVLAWARRWWRPAGRVCHALMLLAAIGCIVWLSHWNLLTWRP
jgi:CubicO group peptidase (beta-lactamase class C family)